MLPGTRFSTTAQVNRESIAPPRHKTQRVYCSPPPYKRTAAGISLENSAFISQGNSAFIVPPRHRRTGRWLFHHGTREQGAPSRYNRTVRSLLHHGTREQGSRSCTTVSENIVHNAPPQHERARHSLLHYVTGAQRFHCSPLPFKSKREFIAKENRALAARPWLRRIVPLRHRRTWCL